MFAKNPKISKPRHFGQDEYPSESRYIPIYETQLPVIEEKAAAGVYDIPEYPSEARFIPIYESQTPLIQEKIYQGYYDSTPGAPNPTGTQSSGGLLPSLTNLLASFTPAIAKFFEYKATESKIKALAPAYKQAAAVSPYSSYLPVAKQQQASLIPGVSTGTVLMLGGGVLLLVLITKKKG